MGVYDYGETESVAYIIMEFVEGRSLKALLDAHERFAPAETVRIMEGVLAGLQYSHRSGVVHRDIKPANIMLTLDGAVKIADFGIARIESSQMTQAGTIMGTPAYMSPEQFMGQTVDLRTDLYSVGVLLYQMLTGERPFDGGMSAIMHKALHTEPPAPSAISVVSPAGFDAVVARAMAKRPEQRFSSADAFAAAIRAALSAPAPVQGGSVETSQATIVYGPGKASAPTGPSTHEVVQLRNSRLPLIGGIAAGVLLLAGTGIFLALRPLGRPIPPPKLALPPPAVAPAQTAPPPPPPAPMPQPVPAPRKTADPAALASLTEALSAARCSLTQVTVSHDRFIVSGVVSKEAESELRTRASAAVSDAPLDWHLSSFTDPYCDILDTVRGSIPVSAGSDAVSVSLRGSPRYLRRDASMVPQVGLPGFPAYLTLDYFISDGSVVHIAPTDRAGPTVYHAGSSTIFGANNQYQALPPFGTDLMIVIATDHPLSIGRRPEIDKARPYLSALKRALATAAHVSTRTQASAMLVETRRN